MIRISNFEEVGLQASLRAMRNPFESHKNSDTTDDVLVGDKDLARMRQLFNAGVEHRTYLRFVMLYMTIEAPLYWWKEMDRYTIGKAQVSSSTMHLLGKRDLNVHDFSFEDVTIDDIEVLLFVVNRAIYRWRASQSKKDWKAVVQMLPSGFMQMRDVVMSAEVMFKIAHERKGHKLSEWETLIKAFESGSVVYSLLKKEDK